MNPTSLEELSLYKRHYTSGPRESLDDYRDLDDEVEDLTVP